MKVITKKHRLTPGATVLRVSQPYQILCVKDRIVPTPEVQIVDGKPVNVAAETAFLWTMEIVDCDVLEEITIVSVEDGIEVPELDGQYHDYIDTVFFQSMGLVYHIFRLSIRSDVNNLQW